MGILSHWMGKKDLVGMDLGHTSVKMVRIKHKSSGMDEAQQWLFEGAVSTKNPENVAAFRKFLRKHNLDHASVVCNIEDPSLKIRRVDLPKMPASDVPDAIRWQMRDVVDGPVNEFVVRYTVIEDYQNGDVKKTAYVAYAIRKNIIQAQTDFLKKIGLDVVAIEPTSVSLVAAFDRLEDWEEDQFYAIVDIGEVKSFFIVLNAGKLFFSRPLMSVCGSAYRNMENDKPGFYTQCAVEIQKSIDGFSLVFRRDKIDGLYLCGGGADIPEFCEALQQALAIPTKVLSPAQKLTMKDGSCLYDTAIGLASYPATGGKA
ncbi:MAG: pilus assembly protein PilM [Deltaproteobacteria bacterium]|nr:MAG: pilus assembly protein PilM [Deltaproteobacteria bacterium]